MPYGTNKDLPKGLKEKLPTGAEEAYKNAYNSAAEKGWSEKRRHSYAWGAVKRNYRKSGDNWVKKAMTNQEKKMLRAANRLRRLVAADFMLKTANPAIAAVGRALLPALRQLGPKVLGLIKNIPPEVWAQIIPALIQTLTKSQGATPRAAEAKDKKPWEEDDAEMDEDDDEEAGLGGALAGGLLAGPVGAGIGALASTLKKNKVPQPEVVARTLILAAVETGNSHRNKARPEVDEAIRLVRQMRAELQVIKEHL